MDDSFYQAHVHSGPHVVLGRRLHPLCLQDILGLMLVKSPYGDIPTNGGTSFDVTMGRLRVAVAICSTPIEELTHVTSTRELGPVVRNLWWKYRTKDAILAEEAHKFDEYFGDYFCAPGTWDGDDGESTPIGAPWPLAVAASLMVNTAMTRKEVWTMPIGEALWLNCAILEQKGATQIESLEQLEAMYELGLRERPVKKKAVNRG